MSSESLGVSSLICGTIFPSPLLMIRFPKVDDEYNAGIHIAYDRSLRKLKLNSGKLGSLGFVRVIDAFEAYLSSILLPRPVSMAINVVVASLLCAFIIKSLGQK